MAATELESLLRGLVGRDAAHSVAEHVPDLVELGRMDAAELATLPAVGARRAAAVVAAIELGRRATTAWPELPWVVRHPTDVADRLVGEMGLLEREELRVLLLTTKNAVVAMRTVYVGNLAGSSVRVGELFRDAVRRSAAGIVVVHNHPSGDPAPSGEDLRITGEIAAAGALLDIALLDHLVIGHGRWVSLRALGAC
ncbi:MAG TPA: DNA repair protein RadC [Candidatus Limnocylindria bacterium]|nr:DNA repair protein RadC [Candidatus Limnocylindria bacterium]